MPFVTDKMSSERASDGFQVSASTEMEVMEEDDDEESESEEDEDEVPDRNVSDVVEMALKQTMTPTAISMENSSHVHIGPRLNYNAPVTINQYVNVQKTGGNVAEDLQQHAIKAPAYVNGFVTGKNVQHIDDAVTSRWLTSHNRRLLMWGCLVLILMLVVIIAVVLNFTITGSPTVENTTLSPTYQIIPTIDPPPDPTPDPTLVLNEEQEIYPASFWRTYPPRFKRNLTHPTPYVVIAHSAEPGCNEPIDCSEKLRRIQNYHVGHFDQPDIGYNFIIDNAGNVYEGRGWDVTNFFQDFVLRRNIGVCFLGNYIFIELSEKQQKSLKDLLALGVKLGKLAEDYKLIAHGQILATESPGKNILRVINSWPHRCLLDCAMPFNTTTTSTTTESNSPSSLN
ncbi:peptidoglycan-recognition protein LA [Anabrus simplex]|uniref:peptidoglycan-recognition protein LA n=1 Tax=Anabrus simplex TaxID=316456 RepID=UPI0035A3D299